MAFGRLSMGPSMTRRNIAAACSALCALLVSLAPLRTVSADPGRLDDDRLKKPSTTIVARVEGNPDGYDVHISVRVTWPGSEGARQDEPSPSSKGDDPRD